jgi:hypothetical protein
MGPHTGSLLPGRNGYRALLLGLAVDTLRGGLWMLFQAEALLSFLQAPAVLEGQPHDARLLLHLLGLLAVSQVVFLGMVLWRPETWGSVAVVPLFGRLLGVGLWLWLSASERSTLSQGAMSLFLVPDVIGVAVLAWFLVAWHIWAQRQRSAS